MSSITIIQQRDAIHFITDAAHYTPTGRIVAFASKITELPAAGCIFSVRGAGYASPALKWLLEGCTSFDQVVSMLPGVMLAVDSAFIACASKDVAPVHRHFIMTIAGWSDELQQLMTGVAATFSLGDPDDTEGFSQLNGYRQYCPFYAPSVFTMPPVSLENAIGRQVEDASDWVEAMDPVVDGLAIFEAQRRFPAIYADNAQYVVGGFAELTTVTRAGVTSCRLKDYPDQVGAYITPEDAEPIADVWARELAWRAENPLAEPLAQVA